MVYDRSTSSSSCHHFLKSFIIIVVFIFLVLFTFATLYSGSGFKIVLTNYDLDLCISDCLPRLKVNALCQGVAAGGMGSDPSTQEVVSASGGEKMSSLRLDDVDRREVLEVMEVETFDENDENDDDNDDGDAIETTAIKIHKLPPEQRLPQCLIIGVRKGGTRALIEFLSLHPSVHTQRHEVHFFDNNQLYAKGLEWYKRQMPFSLKSEITIEKTPAYFVKDRVPERVHQMNVSVKLLLIVRDPVARTLSDYTQLRVSKSGTRKSYPSFESLAINSTSGEVKKNYKAIRRSLYHRHMRKWLRYFRLEQIFLVSAENLVRDPLRELIKVEKFLGLSHRLSGDQFYMNSTRGFYCMRLKGGKNKCLGSSKGRNHVEVRPDVIRKLVSFFRPHNDKFYRLVGRDFGWSR